MFIRRYISYKSIAYGVLTVYFVLFCFAAYQLVTKIAYRRKIRLSQQKQQIDDDWNPWGQPFDQNSETYQASHDQWDQNDWTIEEARTTSKSDSSYPVYEVDILGKAAIGQYLWLHILNGELEQRMNGIWLYGMKEVNHIKFRYWTGPGVVPQKLPRFSPNLVIILNGRELSNVNDSRAWLNHVTSMRDVQSVGVVLLGNEKCENDWIRPYLSVNGGVVKFVFLVYDDPTVDDVHIYQWPLGVATYRGFPHVPSSQLSVESARRYSCNFMGTIYPNSSREELAAVLEAADAKYKCFIKTRKTWWSQESIDSLNEYIRILGQSDLTLNPVGKNTECYRIFESMSYGSVPVVEDIRTPGKCGSSKLTNLRLFKLFHAPLIYVKSWRELPQILSREISMSQQEKADRRQDILEWYDGFKSKMKEKFLVVLMEKFFNLKQQLL